MRVPEPLLIHLRRARDLADRHYAEPLDLDALAASAGVSKYHFLRCFAATYDTTPAAYLAARRIERAQDLLRATNLTVTEVCHLVGYMSLGSFSGKFRQLVGMSPSTYQDHEHLALHAVRHRRGRGQAVLRGRARLRRAHRREHGQRLSLGHDRSPCTARPRGELDGSGPAALRGHGGGGPARARQRDHGGFGLRTDDCQKTYEELTAKGVEFSQTPAERPYGIEAVMRDNSGNWLVLVEPRELESMEAPSPPCAALPDELSQADPT